MDNTTDRLHLRLPQIIYGHFDRIRFNYRNSVLRHLFYLDIKVGFGLFREIRKEEASLYKGGQVYFK